MSPGTLPACRDSPGVSYLWCPGVSREAWLADQSLSPLRAWFVRCCTGDTSCTHTCMSLVTMGWSVSYLCTRYLVYFLCMLQLACLLTVYIIVVVPCFLRLAGVRRGEGLLGRRAPRCSARKPSGGVVQAGQGRILRHFRRQCALTVTFQLHMERAQKSGQLLH